MDADELRLAMGASQAQSDQLWAMLRDNPEIAEATTEVGMAVAGLVLLLRRAHVDEETASALIAGAIQAVLVRANRECDRMGL